MEARPPTACRDSPPDRADTKLASCKWNRPVLASNTSFVSRVGGLSPKIEGPGLQNAGLVPLSARRAYKTRIRCQRAPRALTKLAFGAASHLSANPPTTHQPAANHPTRPPHPASHAVRLCAPTPQPPSPAARPPAPPCTPARSACVQCRPPAPVPAQWSASSSRTESGILPA